MADLPIESAMAREIAEIPMAASRLLESSASLTNIVERINEIEPRIVVFCGRGSSGHVGVYLRYLFEAHLGLIAAAAAPSVMTVYKRTPDMRNALFVVVSQSGRSPDLINATQMARRSGALTIAIINDENSPLADASELILPIGAGTERAVAATKTVVLSMIAGAHLVAALASEDNLAEGLSRLPGRLAEALKCDWSHWARTVAGATAAFVVGRGYGLGCAREIALKSAEILLIPTLGYSAAELRHGPRASIGSTTPVLVLRQNDPSADAIDDLVHDLNNESGMIFAAGGRTGTLPWIGDDHPVYDPVLMLIPAYRAIEKAARERGLDPDNPPHLNKVTRTL
jgi:glucosamine--fructose-6-phosphate aminotransferase (isomerizing)